MLGHVQLQVLIASALQSVLIDGGELQCHCVLLCNPDKEALLLTGQMRNCLRFVAMMLTRYPGVCEFKLFKFGTFLDYI